MTQATDQKNIQGNHFASQIKEKESFTGANAEDLSGASEITAIATDQQELNLNYQHNNFDMLETESLW